MEAAMIHPQSDPYSVFITFRRLLTATERIPDDRDGKAPPPDAESEPIHQAAARADSYAPQMDAINIRLRDLIQKLHDVQSGAAAPSAKTTTEIVQTQSEFTFRLRALAHVDGFMIASRRQAETDRYLFEFLDGGTFRITDKWSGKSTTIWGDPHVDTSDQEGSSNSEFSNLKESDSQTTLLLQDGTRVTLTARDRGIIERVDIFHGNQHGWGIGIGSKEWSEETGLFHEKAETDAASASKALASGDVVHAGGDGADWYDHAGNLIWGATTGPSVTDRPVMVRKLNDQSQTRAAKLDRAV
jgi:hypothetical protein